MRRRAISGVNAYPTRLVSASTPCTNGMECKLLWDANCVDGEMLVLRSIAGSAIPNNQVYTIFGGRVFGDLTAYSLRRRDNKMSVFALTATYGVVISVGDVFEVIPTGLPVDDNIIVVNGSQAGVGGRGGIDA